MATTVPTVSVVHFRDARPPQEVQALLEGWVCALFHAVPGKDPLSFVAEVRATVPSRLTLRFEAALRRTNCYSLRTEGPLVSDGFFTTMGFERVSAPPRNEEGSPQLYRSLATRWLDAGSQLRTTHEVQQAILAALRSGAEFRSAHKEGGTMIRYRRNRFIREDYGEWTRTDYYEDEKQFLAFLREYFDWKTSQHTWPERVSEYDAWKLILRFLEPTQKANSLVARVPWWALLQVFRRR